MGPRIFGSVGNPTADGEDADESAGRAAPPATANPAVSPASELAAGTTPAAAAIVQLETLKARVVHAEMRGSVLEGELADAAKRLARSDAALLSRRAEREVIEQELATAREELKTAKALLAERAADVARAQETMGHVHSSQEGLRRELETSRAHTRDLEQQLRVFEDWVIRLTQERRRNEAKLESSGQRYTVEGAPSGARSSRSAIQAKSTPVTDPPAERELSIARAELKKEREALKSLADKHRRLAAMFTEAKARVTAEKQANAALRHRLKESLSQLEKMRQKLAALGINVPVLEKSRAWSAVRVVLKAEAGLRRSYRRLGKAMRGAPSEEVLLAEVIAQCNYFDAAWYRSQYLDGAETDLDAALHYLRIGASRRYDPGPRFSSGYYLERYPDVAQSGFNPLVHYVRFGEGEGRSIGASQAPGGDDGQAELAGPPRSTLEAPAASRQVGEGPDSVGPPEARFEGPLPALVPVRYPLERRTIETSKPAPESVPENAVPLVLSGVGLGWLRRLPGDVSLEPIAAFSLLSGVDPAHSLQFEQWPQLASSSPAAAHTAAAPGTVLSLGVQAGCEFADVWFLNECDLRARLRGTPVLPDAQRVLRCYQYDSTGERGLSLLCEWRIPVGELGFIDIATQNPYCPLLFVLTTQAGEILWLSLLPFPSLCRGGAHYGELLAVATDEPYVDALRSVSRMLLEKRLPAGLSPRPLRIEVDLTTAIGTERIFTGHLRQWLARCLNVEIASAGPVCSTGEARRTYLEGAVYAPAPAGAKGRHGLVLSIPADALPTLAILLAAPRGCHTQRPGAFVIADGTDGAPKWLVSPPEVEPSLSTLQPLGRAFPSSTNPQPGDHPPDEQTVSAPALPIAIRFCDLSEPDPARLIRPFALEKSEPLLPEVHFAGAAGVAVLYHPSGPPGTSGHLDAFLESLRLQDGISVGELVVLLPEVDDRALTAARDVLRHHLGDRGRVVPYRSGSSYGARVNEAAASAHGELLLVANGDVILHDPRTLATLAGLAQYERTAAASCMLLHRAEHASSPVRFYSAGYFPVPDLPGSERQTGQLRAAPHPGRLPPATWPAAATSSKLLMVRADTWRRLGGFGAGVVGQENDVEYGLRTAAQGYFHFCTSVVSASILDDASASDARAVLTAQEAGRASKRIGCDEFAAAVRVGTLLRSLVT